MISDDDLHRLAVFLGSCAMMMIVLYHFLEVNAKDSGVEDASDVKKSAAASQESAAASPSTVPAATAGAYFLSFLVLIQFAFGSDGEEYGTSATIMDTPKVLVGAIAGQYMIRMGVITLVYEMHPYCTTH
ncbi:Oligosaccaryltransferase-domain-containing protein [Aspergillus novoparasiticus]|uniref:Dolichyl-diphosphooligosaccharide--protein glycosyltransferase subunit 4 n=1 Tax=Aspergillus novoparasiticus TaxID=986946 RepID=A0A5N6F3G2_9EURO|nr:Oligosaccaryltransferase-domain-containing protein [Aspergillus novoparasiticus]